ncbi:MAG: flavin reductase family protein, partial [Clostridia bacterium]
MFKQIDIKKMKFNPFKLIGDEWMLIAAGDEKAHNMMTASWGGLGVLWNKKVVTVYIRPTRYTLHFVDAN